MIFSQRLTSPLAHLWFIAFTLFVMAFLTPEIKNRPGTMIALMGMVALWIAIGTVCWHWVRTRALAVLVKAYFVFQMVWLVLIMTVEIQARLSGSTTAALAILLIFQSSILQRQSRILLFMLLTTLATLFTVRTLAEPERLTSIVISYSLGLGCRLCLVISL